MTEEELEEDFNKWNEYWMTGCYDPRIEGDLWEAEQGEVIYGEEESWQKEPETTEGTI